MLGRHDLAFETNQQVEAWFRPPFDQSLSIQRVWVQNGVDRVSWLKQTERMKEASQLAQTVHVKAIQWLTDYPDDIGAQQSLFAANYAYLDSLVSDQVQDHGDGQDHDRFDKQLFEIMVQGERLIALKPNRETKFWVWQCQQKAWIAKAKRAAQAGDLKSVISAIEKQVAVPLGSLGQRIFQAAHHFAQLLSEDRWHERLSESEQRLAEDQVLDLLEQAILEVDTLPQHLEMECWNFLKDHPRFVAMRNGDRPSTNRDPAIGTKSWLK